MMLKNSQWAGLPSTMVAITLALTTLTHGKGKPPQEDPPTEVPPVRYRIEFPQLPVNAIGGQVINDMNNWGHVVGWYLAGDGTRAFVYDGQGQVHDLNVLIAGGLPEGWRLRSALSINDWMVVVGNIELNGSDPLQVRPIVVDLAAEDPVVDLLPDVGVDFSYGSQINENGDILGVYRTADGNSAAWLFNPGLYGDPASRLPRDGTPLDMSADVPVPLPLSGNADFFHLNNPVGDEAAQVAGTTAQGIAFRYTTGANAHLETFPELDLISDQLCGLNDSGTFCGRVLVDPPRGKSYGTPFRYETALDELPKHSQTPRGINSSGDLILYDVLYRDDWASQYGYVSIDDLVIGSDDDLQLWLSGTSVDMFTINDRAGPSDSGQIAGRLGGVAPFPILFVLTPEPAPAP